MIKRAAVASLLNTCQTSLVALLYIRYIKDKTETYSISHFSYFFKYNLHTK